MAVVAYVAAAPTFGGGGKKEPEIIVLQPAPPPVSALLSWKHKIIRDVRVCNGENNVKSVDA